MSTTRPGLDSASTRAFREERHGQPAWSEVESLRALADGHPPGALERIIERYAGLVYGVAWRRTGQHELAQEVAQNVFAVLARKAAALARMKAPLAAWLHRAAVLEAARLHRKETTRRRVMKEFATHTELTAATLPPAALPDSLLPELDDALDALPRADRELLLARYFEDRSYRELAATTGRSEAALMQQHHRALAKLSRLFQKRGLAVSTAVLASGLGAPFATAAPSSVVTTLAAAAPTLGLSTSLALTLAMQTKTQLALATVAACLVAGTASFFVGRVEGKARTERHLVATRSAPPSSLPKEATAATDKPDATTVVLPTDIQGKLAKATTDWRAATDEKGRAQALAIIDTLTAEEVPMVLAYLESVREENALFLALAERVLPLWAVHEPEAALAWLSEQLPRPRRQKLMERMLEEWGGRDHTAALAWWGKVMDSLEFPITENGFGNLNKVVLSGWARSDPGGLLATTRKDNDPTRLEHGKAMEDALLVAAADSQSRLKLIEAIADLPNDVEKMTFYVKVLGPLMVMDTSAMREVALAFPLEKAHNREDLLVMTAFAPLLFSGDENEAVGWLRQNMDHTAIPAAFERLLTGTVGDLPKEVFQQKANEYLPPPIVERIRQALNSAPSR